MNMLTYLCYAVKSRVEIGKLDRSNEIGKIEMQGNEKTCVDILGKLDKPMWRERISEIGDWCALIVWNISGNQDNCTMWMTLGEY